eukprot:m.10498 g.10498  ORF g.10498 m.10498 type:complete len:238 (+) comp5614_c0_seq1:3-716(+)
MGNLIDRVLDSLYIGSSNGSRLEVTTENKFTHVVSLCVEGPAARVEGVSYLVFPVLDNDDEDLTKEIATAIEFIHAARLAGGRVFVHCRAGVSRSSTIVLAYLLATTPLTLTECFAALKAARDMVQPNPGFWQQLLRFESEEAPALRARLPPLPSAVQDERDLRSLIARGPARRADLSSTSTHPCLPPMSPPMGSPSSSYPNSLQSSLSHSISRMPAHMPLAASPPPLPLPARAQSS